MKDSKQFLDIKLINNDKKTTDAFKKELDSILGFSDTFSRIESELDQFEEKLKNGFNHNEFIDIELARKLYVTSCALFRICQKSPFDSHVPFSLAAISYFVRLDDEKDNFKNIDGFDDDEKVINFIIKNFRLEESIKSKIQIMKEKESRSA